MKKKAKPPSKEVVITLAITETPEGKLNILTSIPDHAEGTIALVLAGAAIEVIRGMMKDAGQKEEFTERQVQ